MEFRTFAVSRIHKYDGVIEESHIKIVLAHYLRGWAEGLNFKDYKSYAFSSFLTANEDSIDLLTNQKTGHLPIKKRDSRILFEINELKGHLEIFHRIFDCVNLNFNDVQKNCEIHAVQNPDLKILLKKIRKGGMSLQEKRVTIGNQLNKSTIKDLIYMLSVIYLDFYKILEAYKYEKPEIFNIYILNDFSGDKSNQRKVIEPIQSSNTASYKKIDLNQHDKVFETVWQAVLYHSILVDCKIKKDCSKKDIPKLVQNFYLSNGKKISKNTFYQKKIDLPNSIKCLNSEALLPKGSYNVNDFRFVKKLLAKEHPETLEIFKKKYWHNSLL